MSGKKDFEQVIRRLARMDGVEVKRGGTNHYKVYLHGVMIATCPYSPSDHRGLKNFKAHLARKGITL